MRGEEEVVSLLERARWIGMPTIVLGELRTGFALGRRAAENGRELRAFLKSPIVEVLDVEDETASIYAEIVVALRRAGRPVPTNDIWIAAVAAREGAPVVTYDTHFAAIERVGSQVLGAG
jgi:tRNA(fMet)-specific endonuclease VapC